MKTVREAPVRVERRWLRVVFVLFCLTPTITGCPIAGYFRFDGVCYKDFSELKTYNSARQTCAADGGLLAMPKTSAINTFIHDLAGGGKRWIGLTDVESEGQWVFEDGETLASSGYDNWGIWEPNDVGGVEDCVEVRADNHIWNDVPCSFQLGFICQLAVGQYGCTFEDGPCGWTQDTSDTFDWTRSQGPTGSSNTGPTSDHTLGTDQGWYLFIETSPPRVAGDVARVLSPAISAGTLCLQFWYHMHGTAIGTLNVYLKQGNTLGTTAWTMTGTQGDQWNQGQIGITKSATFKIVFEGIRGSHFSGDIALDDIIVNTGACQATYEGLFHKEEGHFFGDSPDHIATYSNIDANECARRCLLGYGSYDGVSPTCLSFNHRPAGSPEGGSARCWLCSSDKDTAAFSGTEWDSWPYRNYYQRKHIVAPQDCTDMFALGIKHSHVYTIRYPQPFQAYCEMDTEGGGWTVIQRRQDGSVPFDKSWTEYEQGFGNTSGEYWLGLENIHSLTTQKENELYVYLEDWETNSRFARHSTFSVGNADSKYTATIDGYSGDATDSLDPSTTRHSINNRQFSTTDQDNDGVSTDCASTFGQGGWWYPPSCGYALLNGQYLTGCSVPSASCSSADGIVWNTWRGYGYSLKKTAMMIRPTDFPVSSLRPCENGGTLTSGPEDSGLFTCACPPGWKDVLCHQTCQVGEFGPDCTGTCHCASGDSVCDIRTGVCSSGGCEAGWKGSNCQTVCSPGEFGPGCTGTCRCASGDSVCDIRTGVCSSGGCEAGWKESNCQRVCSPGEFGPGCTGTCRCESGDSVCDIRTGVCSSGGCEAGWKGNDCQSVCSPGEFGPGCTGTCHCASGDSVCDIRTGVCSSGGCEAGWTGSNCQTVPAIISDHLDSLTVVVENEATFSCTGRGVPAPTVVWHHNDEVIRPGDQISVEVTDGGVVGELHVTNSTLTITSARRQDNGQYVCIMSNSAGNDTSQGATLVVQESPDELRVNVTVVNSTTLHVTWTVGVTGNLDIIDSQVRYKRSDAEDWGTWASTGVSDVNGAAHIYNLRLGVMYDVQVRVNNSLGWSDPDQGMGTTDEAPPGPPHNLQAVPSSHNSVHLTWESPIETNGKILNYTVQYGASEPCGENAFLLQVTTTDDSITTVIGNLDPYTNYTFRVRGANSAGQGDFSDCKITRTLEYYPTTPVLQMFEDQDDCNCQTPNVPRPVQLRVAWRRPDHIHGQLQAYRISLYNSTGGDPFYQENMTSGLQQENLTAVITSSHLQPANNYSVTVSALNNNYRGNESYPHMARTSDGCPDAPTVTRMANSECGVTWTAPTKTRGRLTGYNVTYTDTPRLSPDKSEQGISYDTLGADQQQWSKSLDELPANSLVRVTVRAVTCAQGDYKGEEFTCEVSRVEPPPPLELPTGPPLNASATSFPMVLPKVSERNGPIRCCQVIVIKMTKSESLADLETRVGEPDVMLTIEAPDDGKTEPYVALSLSREQYRSTNVVQIGNGGPCGHEWCCERSELVDSSLAKESSNKKLHSGEKYTAAVRCYVNSGARRRKRSTERLYTTSGYIEPVITETSENRDQHVTVPATVAGCVAALLVAIVVTVGIICYRRRNAKDDQESTGPRIDLKIIKEDRPSIKEVAENPTALGEDSYPYETTIYSIADLVTVDDVVGFLKTKGFGEYAAAFRRNKVDGEGAMSLTGDMLAELVPDIGPRAKLQKALQELKGNPSAESNRPAHWEIPRSSLKLGKILGKGQFGEVRMGELRKRGVTQTVAVKTLRASAEGKDKEDLLGELDILVIVGRHDNIINLIGACTVEGPLTLVVEYAPNGCLKDWLRNNRPKELNQTDNKNIAASGILLPMEQLIMFGVDIANGMSHLAAMQCVHRDLAARNVLLGKDLTAKISDFGLSRDIYEESEYVKSTKSQLPVRWIAYESLFYQVYTVQSDVWSFGILMWEIMTMGKQPYGRITGKELLKLLPGGYRLEKPDLCPQDIYDVMKSCWETLPENRPTFPELKATLDRIIQDYKTYASLLK